MLPLATAECEEYRWLWTRHVGYFRLFAGQFFASLRTDAGVSEGRREFHIRLRYVLLLNSSQDTCSFEHVTSFIYSEQPHVICLCSLTGRRIFAAGWRYIGIHYRGRCLWQEHTMKGFHQPSKASSSGNSGPSYSFWCNLCSHCSTLRCA